MSQAAENYHLYFCNVKQAHLRQVLWCISKVADDHGYCWPSQAHIAQFCNVDERTVRRNIKKLVELGELKIAEIGSGRTTTTYVMPIYIPDVGVFFDGTPQDRGRTSDVHPQKSYKNVRPGRTSRVHPEWTSGVRRNINKQHLTKESPPTPLNLKNPAADKNFSSPHSQVAAYAALKDAPTSAPPPSAVPLTLGLGGADAPPIVAAVGGVEAQGGIAAVAAIPEQPVIEVHAGSEPQTNPTPITGVHIVSKIANGKKTPNDWALIARFNAVFNRAEHLPLTDRETRDLRRLTVISDVDLTIIETVAGVNSARAQKWFPKQPWYLFSHWPSIVTEARKFLSAQHRLKLPDEPEWQRHLNTVKQLLPTLADGQLDGVDKTLCGAALIAIPANLLCEFFQELTDEQIKSLTAIKENYEQNIQLLHRQRAQNGHSRPSANPEPALANAA